MEIEKVWDTPDFIIGQITALKRLTFSDQDAAETITDWGFKLSSATVNKYWNMYLNGDISNARGNCGRKKLLDEKTQEMMINKVLANRWTTAADLYHDSELNSVGASIDTI